MTCISVFAVTPNLTGQLIKIQGDQAGTEVADRGQSPRRMLIHPSDSRIYSRNNPDDTPLLLFVLTPRDTFSIAGVLFN